MATKGLAIILHTKAYIISLHPSPEQDGHSPHSHRKIHHAINVYDRPHFRIKAFYGASQQKKKKAAEEKASSSK